MLYTIYCNFFHHTQAILAVLVFPILRESRSPPMLLGLFAVFGACEDRRLDPFQFNLCLWDLEGLDPIYNVSSLGGTRAEDEDTIAKLMYSRLSTCDMFVIPGLKNQTTAENLVHAMANHDFVGFERYPKEGVYDSTVLSRIDLNDAIPFEPRHVQYPIPNSKCGCNETGEIMMDFSFYANVTFHDPVPDSHLVSVRFKHGSTPTDCAYREAQAQFLCEATKPLFENGHVYLAGSFEADTSEPYYEILTKCGYVDTISYAKGTDKYTRVLRENGKKGRSVYWDIIFVHEAVKKAKYLDQLVFVIDSSAESLSLDESLYATYATTLYTHQPLTARWKKFEIAYSACLVPASVGFFVFLMLFSREKKAQEVGYDNIGEN